MVREIIEIRERESECKHNFCTEVLVFFCSVEESPCSPPVTVPVRAVNFGVDRTIIVSQSVDPEDKITRLTLKLSKYLIGFRNI